MSNQEVSSKVRDDYINSILDCLYIKMNITSISVKKEKCRRLIPFETYEYILEVKSDTKGTNSDFIWNGRHDTLDYNFDGRKMCYHATGPITKIKVLN